MDHHGHGWATAAPQYIDEKLSIIHSQPEDAYAALDRSNQLHVLIYCAKWGLEIPMKIQIYEKQLKVAP